MQIPSWFDESCSESLPEDYQTLVDRIGFDNTIQVALVFGGSSAYCPNLKKALSQAKKRRIISEYMGYNVNELAQKYDVSDRWVYEIISKAQKDAL